MYWHHILQDGSGWFLAACLVTFAGLVIGLYTQSGRGITYHAYTKSEGQLGSDLPPEALGRVELEPLLWRRAHRPRRTARRRRRDRSARK